MEVEQQVSRGLGEQLRQRLRSRQQPRRPALLRGQTRGGAPAAAHTRSGRGAGAMAGAGALASGDITTLPPNPDDGGNGGFPPGNFKEPKRLYCKNGGYFLRIHSDGRVDGVREKSDPHIKLQLQATAVGEVLIKGIYANRYLAMNEEGRLFGARRPTDESFFLERLEPNNYNTYRSRKYPEWYVALKRNGQFKLGSKTGMGQKAILFLPMSARS